MSKKKKKKRNLLKWFMITGGVFLVLFLAGCSAVLSYGNNLIDKGKVKSQSESSTIYDQDGHELKKLYANQNREYVNFQQIPDLAKKAFVDTEDARFYQHNGIDFQGILRALYRDIRAGGAVEGASTITQQLAKNVYLTDTKTVWRKIEEAIIAINLERNYSKDQILEFYLNEIYFGNGNYGIETASKYYFGKDASQLDLAEIATLAGMPKAPNTYAPTNDYEKSVERRKTVLSLMVKNGAITQQQADEAGNEQLKLAKVDTKDKSEYQTYIDYVLKEAEDKYHLTEDQLYRGGYDIYTALDTKAQLAMANAFNNPKLFPDSRSNDPVQGAMVIIDPHTGGIAAMTGGRDYKTGDFNRVIAGRSPGSTFKPLAVYGPALENGYHPYDMIKDEKITYPGGYTPSNWEGDPYLGETTIADALKRSDNAPAVWLLNELGINTAFQYLDKFGIPYDKVKDRKLGIALGDLTNGVSPLNMAKAYSAFDNNGVVIEPHAITKIKDNEGHEIQGDFNSTTVVTEQTAYSMTNLLEGVVQDGTAVKAKMNRPVAGKTGTTQMQGTNGNRDAWFVGYTPEYVGAVWMGYDKSDSKTNYLRQGSEIPAKFFSVVMTEALQGRPVKPFPKPADVQDYSTPPAPPSIPKVQDLKGAPLADSIHLTWTVANDNSKHYTYRVYRYTDDPTKKQQIGETDKGEWIDLTPKVDQLIHYVVTMFDADSKAEGDVSNVVEIKPNTLQAPDLKPPQLGQDSSSTVPGAGPNSQLKQSTPKKNSQQPGTLPGSGGTTYPSQQQVPSPPTIQTKPGKFNHQAPSLDPTTQQGNQVVQ